MKRVLATLLLISQALVASCASQSFEPPSEETMLRAQAMSEERGQYRYAHIDYEAERISFSYGSPQIYEMNFEDYQDYVQRVVRGVTVVTSDPAHGTQVEYLTSNGDTYLWYPGNSIALKGAYRTEINTEPYNIWGDRTAVLICFSYAVGSRNPVTGAIGPREECASAYSYISKIVGKRRGDPFELSSGKVPFDLNEVPRWSDAILERKGVSSSDKDFLWPEGSPVFEFPVPHYAYEE